MNKRLTLTYLGGYPLSQKDLDWMQVSYRGALSAISTMIGNKVIISGMAEVSGNVSAGWISINNELLPFVAGTIGTGEFIIDETSETLTFKDGNGKIVRYERVARFSAGGPYQYSELVRLTSLVNIWQPGDMKEKIFVDGATADAYIAANFVSGIGINEQSGWAIVTTIYPDTAGRVMVPVDAANANLDQVGKMYGSKTHTLAGNEQGAITVAQKVDDIGGGTDSATAMIKINGVEVVRTGAGSNQSSYSNNTVIPAAAAANAFSIMQETYAILKLVKL